MNVALAARSPAKLDEFGKETGAKAYATATPAKRDEVEKLFAALDAAKAHARRRRLQRQLPHARAVRRARSGRSRESDRHHRLCRLPGGAGGGQAHAAARAGRDPVHRRVGERQGLCAVGAVCHGQVRAARPGAEHGARIVAAGHPRRAFRHRRRHRQRAPAGARGQAGLAARSRRHRAELLHVLQQPRSAWTQELELRPWVEKF